MTIRDPVAHTEAGAGIGERISAAVDARAVCRDHPFHRALLAGEATPAQLRAFAVEQWHFHRRYPAVLAVLAERAAGTALADELSAAVAAQDPARPGSLLARWEKICRAWGIDPTPLVGRSPGPASLAVLGAQLTAARRPSPWVGYVVLTAAVTAETVPWMAARRRCPLPPRLPRGRPTTSPRPKPTTPSLR